MYAKIIVDLTTSAVDTTYTYEIPEGMVLSPGYRVLVPFSKGNRSVEGFVTELCEQAPNIAAKSVICALEDYPVLDKKQIELAEWMKRAYRCTMASALRVMIPAQLRGMRIKEKTVRVVTYNKDFDILSFKSSLQKKDGTFKSSAQLRILSFVMDLGVPVATADLKAFFGECSNAISALIKRGAFVEDYKTQYRRPHAGFREPAKRPTLTREQSNALSVIEAATQANNGTVLLRGVTGSGKTEVYMCAVEHAIQEGGGAIVLVPEIALTPQTVDRFVNRFGDTVAVLHSRLSAGERFDEWQRIRRGEVNVVVGARSAVFAPLEDIRLIVIDEEHEPSYLSETTPRYSAIEVARKRCAQYGCALVLGSATPSITSSFRAERGKYTLVRLDNRVMERALPSVHIVDMKKEFSAGNNSIFSGELSESIERCIANGEQVILFLNRRGYSTFITCRGCGHVIKCDDCDVSMTYHKHDNLLKCHYCNKTRPLPRVCPNCGMPYLKHFGIGTEQIENELKKQFPQITAIRMDSDTTCGKDSHERLLERFRRGEADVLIGTQMVAKGLDFPNVTLVGVVMADAMLSIPDYRSSERAFELLTQVAGRAGRSDKPGNVIIQTYMPDHTIITLAASQNYDEFYKYVINERKKGLFPPFSLFLRGVFKSECEQDAQKKAAQFAKQVFESMKEKLPGDAINTLMYVVSGPAPIKRVKGQFVFHVIVKLFRNQYVHTAVDAVFNVSDGYTFSDGFCGVEIDPRF